jgi:hypothetical protein
LSPAIRANPNTKQSCFPRADFRMIVSTTRGRPPIGCRTEKHMLNAIDHTNSAATPEQPTPHTETALTAEIAKLWSIHKDSKAAARHTRAELKTIRRELGQKLFEMKSILVRTGRSGGWAAYLRSQKLPLTTADRYVLEHEVRLSPAANLPSGELSEPTEDEIRQSAQKLIPRLSRLLSTQEAVYHFVHEFVGHIPAADYRATDWGLEVLRCEPED